jgi:hypothetical protein
MITMLPLEEIHPHEEYDPQILLKITNSLLTEEAVHDPLLVSSDNFVILDGTHRYWALTRLGCKSVPVAVYDYNSSQVGIGCWYRCLDKAPDLNLPSFVRGGMISKREGLRAVQERKALFAMVYEDSSYAAISESFDIFEAYSLLSFFEQGLRGRGHKLTYATENDAMAKLEAGEIGAILASPPIRKEEVVLAGTAGRLFPLKSSRHIINSRPIGLNVPLEWLYQGAQSSEKRLKSLISRGTFRALPSGSVVNGRRYEEEVYIFELGSFGHDSGDRDKG